MMVELRKYWNLLIARVLFSRARYVLEKFDPLVIGITGSMGKTSTKEAVYTVLKQKFKVGKNEGNLNNEIGMPIAIIKSQKPSGIWSWLKFLVYSYFAVRKIKEYPPYLILEMAADKKGDISYLCRMARPAIGVVTNVADCHYEFFGSKRAILREKRKLLENLPKSGRAVINYDDENVRMMAKKTKAKVLTYGLKKGADLVAQNILITNEGTSYKLIYNGAMMPVRLKLLGYPAVYASLAAIGVGLSLDMNILDVVEGVGMWQPVPGRMNLIPGVRGITILDDSYNASSKEMMLAAFKTISSMKIKGRKVGILGSMWELGSITESTHLEVGKSAAREFDILICVEKNAPLLRRGAMMGGMLAEDVLVYDKTSDLLPDILNLVKDNDFVFVKGSQGKNRLEKVVKVLMKDKEKAAKLLVRQSREWLASSK